MNALCLCRDQPEQCMCRRREIEASERRQVQMRAMRKGLMVAAGMATPEPDDTEALYPCGYGERGAKV